MRVSPLWFRRLVFGFVLPGSALSAKGAPDFSIFAYDASKPVVAEQKVVAELPGLTLSQISFEGSKGGRAIGSLVVPRKSGKHPAVIFMHELGASRTEFLNEAMELARTGDGTVSLLLDAPWSKPAPWRRTFDPAKPGNDRDLQLEAVGDARRAVDYLTTRPDIAGESLAFVGHSYGANWGSILAAVEKRITIFVLMAGAPSVTEFLRQESGPENKSKPDAAYLESIRPFDPELYLPEIRAKKLFLQFATYDLSVSAEEGRKFIALTADPKRVAWYECGHEMLDRRALRERFDFLKTQLNLRPRSPRASPHEKN